MVDQVALETGVTIINLYQPLAGKPELSRDDVHPSMEGATVIAETVAGAITGKSATRPPSPLSTGLIDGNDDKR